MTRKWIQLALLINDTRNKTKSGTKELDLIKLRTLDHVLEQISCLLPAKKFPFSSPSSHFFVRERQKHGKSQSEEHGMQDRKKVDILKTFFIRFSFSHKETTDRLVHWLI